MWQHQQQTQHDVAVAYKYFVFELVNFFFIQTYIAFIKPLAPEYTCPWNTNIIYTDKCRPSGCMEELGEQHGIILVTMAALVVGQDYLLPRLMLRVKQYVAAKVASPLQPRE